MSRLKRQNCHFSTFAQSLVSIILVDLSILYNCALKIKILFCPKSEQMCKNCALKIKILFCPKSEQMCKMLSAHSLLSIRRVHLKIKQSLRG